MEKLDSNKQFIIDAIDLLRDKCHWNAKDHGFWDDEDLLLKSLDPHYSEEEYSKIKQRIISLFNSEKIALEMSELAERLECLRKDPTKMDEHCSEFFNVEIEVADLIIRALDFCGRRNLRIGEAIIAKMKYNSEREYKHGKNF